MKYSDEQHKSDWHKEKQFRIQVLGEIISYGQLQKFPSQWKP